MDTKDSQQPQEFNRFRANQPPSSAGVKHNFQQRARSHPASQPTCFTGDTASGVTALSADTITAFGDDKRFTDDQPNQVDRLTDCTARFSGMQRLHGSGASRLMQPSSVFLTGSERYQQQS